MCDPCFARRPCRTTRHLCNRHGHPLVYVGLSCDRMETRWQCVNDGAKYKREALARSVGTVIRPHKLLWVITMHGRTKRILAKQVFKRCHMMIPHKINKKSPFETQLAFRTVSFLLQISHLAFIVNYNMDIVEKYKKNRQHWLKSLEKKCETCLNKHLPKVYRKKLINLPVYVRYCPCTTFIMPE